MSYTKRIPIRLDDVDFAQVLYFPRQVHLFVVALEDFFKEALGLDWLRMHTVDNVAIPTVDLQVTYRRPLCFGDEADVELWVAKLGTRKAVFAYEVRNAATGEITCRATQTVVFVNNTSWKAVPIPEPYRSALSRHVADDPR